MFLMMTNGYSRRDGGQSRRTLYRRDHDWQSVWLIFAGYSLVLAFAFVAVQYKHVRQPTAAQQACDRQK